MFALKLFKPNVSSFKYLAPEVLSFEQHRFRTGKHWNPKYRKLRALKVAKVELPDFEFERKPEDEVTKEEMKARMKERGILPQRPWSEKPFFISSTGGIFEPYVPPEGDGKMSAITPTGAKQKLEYVEKKGKSMMAVRKIRNFIEDFEFWSFLEEAQIVYNKAHSALINKDRDGLMEFVTERAYPEIVHNIRDKTVHWKFLESIEKPTVAHVRCTNIISDDNIFAQLTVRFHSQQLLAVYDRFGRLMHGSETVPKDVLEYVVFERHLANKYGKWRIHDKIIPDWMPQPEPPRKTLVTGRTDLFAEKSTSLVKPESAVV